MLLVQITKDGVHDELLYCGTKWDEAEKIFWAACAERIWNWHEYTDSDKAVIEDQFFERYGTSAIALIDISNDVTDDTLRSELTNQPPATVEKVKRWIFCGEIGDHQETISDILSAAGNCLDAAESHEICGEILFQAEDDEYYVGTVEFGIVKANPDYLKEALDEADDRNVDIGDKNE